MKNIIIGTAGHIDHGKTTLIKALTGRNTDRFKEEQERGITIDLGFTYFDLPSSDRVGIIDVPGHEKFINNMVAGVAGMDLVLLVVAADEGIMPQTREHMDILNILGIEKSIIVLNKVDLVDEEWLELVEEEIKDELKDTFLANAPVVKVSAATGFGISELVDKIQEMTEDEIVPKDIHTIPRLPIDRVFSLSGHGTIITGTQLSGTISKDTELMMYPIEKECKIRSIQVHGVDEKESFAGQRVAINISNIKKDEIKRGCVLAPKNSMKNTDLLDVKLEVLKDSNRTLTNHSRLHFFSGTSELLCRAVLLDKEEIAPGESGFVQLRLEEKIALRKGDKYVVRYYSPMETIGGGVILEPNPTVKRRFDEKTIEELKQKESGSSADVIRLHVANAGIKGNSNIELAKLTALSIDEVNEDLELLANEGNLRLFPMKKETIALSENVVEEIKTKLLTSLSAYEEKYPYRYGEEKARVLVNNFKELKPVVFDKLLEDFEEKELIKRRNEYISSFSFAIRKDQIFAKVSDVLLSEFKKAKFDFAKYNEIQIVGVDKNIVDDILNILISEEKVVKIAENTYTLKEYVLEAIALVKEKLEQNNLITIAEIRDELNTTRKSAKPILEYMDSIRITKKVGAETERVAY
ncbi:MAG: selenocysteine-specific translation elongation factor [Lachnospiraceae bacterium]|nr:selenocysteine-specific translation elongation factor [Lachnospiraceae bacterium]